MPVLTSFQTQAALWSWGRGGPLPSNFFIGLSTGSGFTANSTILDFLNTEVVGNGYARQPIVYTADGTYGQSPARHNMPNISPQITPSGGSIIFRTIFILYNSRAESKVQFPASAVNAATDTIAVNAHGLANGEAISIQDTGLFGLPGGLAVNTLYTAFNVTSNTFQISSNGTSAIDITSAGSGPYNLIYAKGGVREFTIRPSNETATSGTPILLPINSAMSEITYV
jgi:hypothetical protein